MIDKVYALQYTEMDTSYVYTKKMNVCVFALSFCIAVSRAAVL